MKINFYCLATILFANLSHAYAADINIDSASSSSSNTSECPALNILSNTRNLMPKSELIVGTYEGAENITAPHSNCSCHHVLYPQEAPIEKQLECENRCLLDADYSKVLSFNSSNAKHVFKGKTHVLIKGKQATVNALVNLMEKGVIYRFCAYVNSGTSPFKYYQINPLFALQRIKENEHGQ